MLNCSPAEIEELQLPQLKVTATAGTHAVLLLWALLCTIDYRASTIRVWV